MKAFILSTLFYFLTTQGFAQKPPISLFTHTNWPSIVSEIISNDGKYVAFIVHTDSTGDLLTIKSIDNSWNTAIPKVSKVTFSEDSKRIMFILPGDSLCILEIANAKMKFISDVKSFKLPTSGIGQWLACQLKTGELILYNLFNGEKKKFLFVKDYWFANNENQLILQISQTKDTVALQYVNLRENKEITFWQGRGVSNLKEANRKLVFIGENNKAQQEIDIWIYKLEEDSARLWVNNKTFGIDSNFTIANRPLKLSPDGNHLFFSLQQKGKSSSTSQTKASVDVWNYNDERLQSHQLTSLSAEQSRSYMAVIRNDENKVIQLEYPGDDNDVKLSNCGNGEFILKKTSVNRSESYRRKTARPDIYLMSIIDGSRKLIAKQASFNPKFSPGGNYLIWYDFEKKGYYTYSLKTGKIANISEKIPFPIFNEYYDRPDPPSAYREPIWLSEDTSLLICDHYDVWRVDPMGVKKPQNITSGYGRANNTILRLVMHDDSLITLGENRYLLAGFNLTTKYNGFFSSKLMEGSKLIQLVNGPEITYFESFPSSYAEFSTFLLKAKHANTYLIKRMSVSEFPNLYYTKNFQKFNSISALKPEKEYNWISSELFNWKSLDGRISMGIIYKPENFDSKKRYPVVFSIYERKSDGLNTFIDPELSNGPMNIPYFVSNGYLVVCPDINYTIGKPGESAYNYILSAKNALSKMSWVDSNKIGIHGHSFGGYQTNYLITRTNQFAAASSAAGPSDFVSFYSSLGKDGTELKYFLENWQLRIGASLWQKPDSYIQNSPIFRADKVSTPLLIMHNKGDGPVPWQQGAEWFTALRYLGKRVWMLQYDGEDHSIFHNGENKLDYTIRLTQFFNHYLKSAPAPIWMSQGIPARLKSITTGYPLDPSGSCSPTCPICRSWNTKMKKDSIATMKEIQERKIEEHW